MSQTFTVQGFRGAFEEFKDATRYPDSLINEFAAIAQMMVSQCLWKSMYLTGVYLYIAHELVLEVSNRETAVIGGDPGQNAGIVSAKTIGPVSATYDVNGTSERAVGQWNLTTYGKRFIRYARIFGAGAVQL